LGSAGGVALTRSNFGPAISVTVGRGSAAGEDGDGVDAPEAGVVGLEEPAAPGCGAPGTLRSSVLTSHPHVVEDEPNLVEGVVG
jgi:hypothetical protein